MKRWAIMLGWLMMWAEALPAQTPVISDVNATPSGLSQTLAPFAGRQFTLTVNGQNFISTSVVYVGTAPLPTAFVNPTQLTATVPASALLTLGTFPVTVANGGSTVTPAIVSVNINSATAVGAYQATINYDKTVVSLQQSNVTGGNGAGFTSPPTTINIDNVAGKVTLNSFQTGNAPSGAFTVANLSFASVALGTTNLTLSGVTLTNTTGGDLPASGLSLSSNSVVVSSASNVSNAVNLRIIERGDVNVNRSISIGDALVMALTAGGLVKPLLAPSVGDINFNGSSNIGDALVLALFSGRALTNLPSPTITSVSPSPAIPGSNMTINGSGFSTTLDSNQVLFTTAGGGVVRTSLLSAPATGVQTTAMVVLVPNEAVSGPMQVFRLDAGGVGSDEFPLSVSGTTSIPLFLTSIAPFDRVAPGGSVVLQGLGFSATAANNTVTFKSAGGTITGAVTAASSTSLTVTVPSDAVCGDVTVIVSGQTSNPRSIIVSGTTCSVHLARILGGGVPGDSVVIEGTGFNVATPASNVVRFAASGNSTTVAPVIQAGGTQLHVRIPAGAITGGVTVATGGSTSNTLNFTLPGLTDIVQIGTPPASATVGTTVNWTIQAVSGSGAPVSGVVIAFARTAGNGSVSAPTVTTDTSGQASVTLTMDTTAGTNSFQATTSALSRIVNLSITGTAGPVTQLAKISGDAQTGEAGAALANPFVVEARDQYGNTVSGAGVTFSVTSGGGSVNPSGVQTTPANGRVSATGTPGPVAGIHVFRASAGAVTSDFTATATLTPSQVSLISGNNQAQAPNTPLVSPLVVKVTNAAGIPVPGFTVNWAATSGGGSVSNSTSSTGSNGQTQVTATLGAALGTQTFTATASGLSGSPVTFTATARFVMTPAFIDVVISSGTTLIGGYQVTIAFDKNKVLLNSANVTGGTGAGFTGLPTTVVIDNAAGRVTVNAFQTSDNPQGNFTVARLTFTPIAAGTFNLISSGITVTDTFGNDVSSSFLSLSTSTVTIN